MRNVTPACQSNVVQLSQQPSTPYLLTHRDRRDLENFQGRALVAGYERLTICGAALGDDREAAEYVLAHRLGEAWSSWGFARAGRTIWAWNAVTAENSGPFESLQSALEQTISGSAERQF